MSTMQDQPAQDQPGAEQQLTPQHLAQLVQLSANEVVKNLALKARHREVNTKTIDALLQEKVAELTLMHLHLDGLTKMLVARGFCTEAEIHQVLVAEFATHANELAGKPQIVVPRR